MPLLFIAYQNDIRLNAAIGRENYGTETQSLSGIHAFSGIALTIRHGRRLYRLGISVGISDS